MAAAHESPISPPPPFDQKQDPSPDQGPSSSHAPIIQRRRPVAPYIPAFRAHPSDAFTGYSEPITPGESPYISIRGLYSSSRFDTLSVLSRVYTRPNPKIELGPVDDSVSFVVVDSMQHDFPIVYCSQNFYNLTGYKPEEIVGRNLRFLQYPPPDVPNASSVDRPTPRERSPAVEAFKKSLMLGQECQASLINYRRDGEPFLNLISAVPIRWKEPNGEEREYYVGFQVDLNEALENTSPSSSRPAELAHDTAPQQTVDYSEPRGPGDETWVET